MKTKKRNGAIVLFILLLTFWMIIASSISLIELTVGFFASLLIVLYSYNLVFTVDDSNRVRPRMLKALFILVFTLLKEIVVANLHVAKIVLSRNMKIDPGFVIIKQPLKKDLNKALYGNAITLTPGTLTIDMSDDKIIIHGLRIEYAKGIEGSHLEKVFIDLEEAGK
jgi:multicomponent Na+:H+ antiporter subunit E